MIRYIDADELLKRLPDDLPYKGSVKRVLIQAPAADAVEVVHASWEGRNGYAQYGYYCTHCEAVFTGVNAEWIAKEHNYCPKCGAKMDGKRSEK